MDLKNVLRCLLFCSGFIWSAAEEVEALGTGFKYTTAGSKHVDDINSRHVVVDGKPVLKEEKTNSKPAKTGSIWERVRPESFDDINSSHINRDTYLGAHKLTLEEEGTNPKTAVAKDVEDGGTEEFCIWSNWGPCSTSCNYGIHSRTLVNAMNPSAECRKSQDMEKMSCMNSPCPLDCIFDETWTAWTECTVPCDGGSRYRMRLITREAMFGGAPCSEEDLMETEICNSDPCAYECRIEGTWSAWSECENQDGVLRQTRQIPFTQAAKANRIGPNITCDETAQYRMCSSGDVSPSLPSFECMQTAWSSWSPCSVSCGMGTQSRTRKILIPSVGSADPCGPTYESQNCNMINCLESNIAALCSRRRNTYIPLGTCSAEYIYCTPGAVAVFSTCSEGQVFSVSVGLCAKLETIPECAALSKTENACQGRPNGLYPVCSCCPQYMACWESVSIARSCGAGQVFTNYPYGRCVDRAQAAC